MQIKLNLTIKQNYLKVNLKKNYPEKDKNNDFTKKLQKAVKNKKFLDSLNKK
jgi:hypothetical protein